jgi:hypothetical protein
MMINIRKHSTMRRLLHLTILLLTFSFAATAQNKYWVASAPGNWSNPANWSNNSGGPGGAGIPLPNETAVFTSGGLGDCIIDIPATIVGGISVATSYTGTISPLAPGYIMNVTGVFGIAGGTFTAPSTLTVAGIFVQNNGVFNSGDNVFFGDAVTFNGGTANLNNGTLLFNRNLTINTINHTLNPGTSTVVVGGDAASSFHIDGNNAGTVSFYNLTLNKTNTASDNLNIGVGDAIVVLNDFEIQNGYYRGANSTLQVGRNFTLSTTSKGGIANLEFIGTEDGVATINSPWVTAASGMGTTVVNKDPNATLSFVTDLPSNTINFSQLANGTFTVNSGIIDFPDGDDVDWIYNNFVIGANGTVSGTNGNMIIRGNFLNSGNFIGNTGTVTFEANTTRSYSVGTAAENGTTEFYNVVLNITGGNTLNIQAGDRLSAANNLTLQNGYFFVPGGSITNQAFVRVGGNLVVTTGSNNMPPSIHLEFGGPNAQTVTFAAGTESYFNGNISFVKTAPNTVTLNSPMELNAANQTVTFNTGILVTDATNIMHFASNGAVALGGNAGSHIAGPVMRTGSTAFTFPTGDGSVYGPIHISGGGFNTGITTATYLAQYFNDNPDGTYSIEQKAPGTPADLKVSEAEYWILDQLNATPVTAPRVWLSFEDARSGGVTDPSTLGVIGWEFPGWWQLLGNGGLQSVGGVDFIATAQANVGLVTSGTPVFTLATIDTIANPLPVTWLSFSGRYYAGAVELNWSTSMELNNEEYTIERSADGHNFTGIGNVAGVGNTTSISRYSFKDVSPLNGTSYYRIKQTDRDGKFSYSDVIRITAGDAVAKGLRIFPNPVAAKLPLTLENGNWANKKVTVTIYNAIGGIVRQEQLTFGSDSRAKLNVDGLQKGSYFITTSINNEKQTLQFFIQ